MLRKSAKLRTPYRSHRHSRTFASVPEARPFIGGRYHDDRAADKLEVKEPASGKHISTLHIPSSAQIQIALTRSNEAYADGDGVWSSPAALPLRYKALNKLANLLYERAPQLAELETRQTGRAIREMKAQLGRVGEWFEYFASLIRTQEDSLVKVKGEMRNEVRRVPLGVVLQCTPWNHPLLIAVKKLAPALAAGTSVILKGSELTPLTVLELGILAKEAGIPDDVLQILPGPGHTIGEELIRSKLIRKIDLTGSTATGRRIGLVAGENLVPFTAELGGKAPLIVFHDQSLEVSVAGALFASFIASGQTCVSATRIIVHHSIYEEFLHLFAARARQIEANMGDPLSESTSMGSLISAPHLAKVHSMVQEGLNKDVTGLDLIIGGQQLKDTPHYPFDLGHFYPPTILALSPHSGSVEENKMRQSDIWRKEVFGPVVISCPFRDEAHAIELANDCDYSLGASVWTRDHALASRVIKRLQSGVLWMNTHHRNDPASPWGGLQIGRNASGLGKENGLHALHAYSQVQSITYNLASEKYQRTNEDWFQMNASRYG